MSVSVRVQIDTGYGAAVQIELTASSASTEAALRDMAHNAAERAVTAVGGNW